MILLEELVSIWIVSFKVGLKIGIQMNANHGICFNVYSIFHKLIGSLRDWNKFARLTIKEHLYDTSYKMLF